MIAVVILLRVNCFSENIVVAETSYQKLENYHFATGKGDNGIGRMFATACCNDIIVVYHC